MVTESTLPTYDKCEILGIKIPVFIQDRCPLQLRKYDIFFLVALYSIDRDIDRLFTLSLCLT